MTLLGKRSHHYELAEPRTVWVVGIAELPDLSRAQEFFLAHLHELSRPPVKQPPGFFPREDFNVPPMLCGAVGRHAHLLTPALGRNSVP